MKKILLVGESWTSQSTHYKGFDTFQNTYYELGAKSFVESLKGNFEVNYMPSHIAQTEFPSKLSDLEKTKGIAYRDENTIKINEPEKIVPQERLDYDLPGYAWDLLPYKKKPFDLYRSPLWHAEYEEEFRSPYAAIQTSLGCMFGCDFCMINIISSNSINI